MFDVRYATPTELGFDPTRELIWLTILETLSGTVCLTTPVFSIRVDLKIKYIPRCETVLAFYPKTVVFKYGKTNDYNEDFENQVTWNMDSDTFNIQGFFLNKFMECAKTIVLSEEEKKARLINLSFMEIGTPLHNRAIAKWIDMGCPIFEINGKEISYNLLIRDQHFLKLGTLHLNNVSIGFYPNILGMIKNTHFVDTQNRDDQMWLFCRTNVCKNRTTYELETFKKVGSDFSEVIMSLNDKEKVKRWLAPFDTKVQELESSFKN